MTYFFKKKHLWFFIVPILSGLIFYLFPLTIPNVQADTAATTSLLVSITICGNNILESGEQCDGTDLGGETCVMRGYAGGSLGCNGSCVFDFSGCIIGGPSGWVTPVKETKVILQGKAYPDALITVLVDGDVVTVAKADAQSNFKVELNTLTAGVYNLGLWAEDNKGRKSVTLSLSLTVSYKMTTTIGSIFIPPTIQIEKDFLNKGEVLNISGQSAPQSEISIYISGISEIMKKTIANEKGEWVYSFNTSELKEGLYSVKAKSLSLEGLTSNFSNVLEFGLGKKIMKIPCLGADLNKDGRVDLVDFSILLHWWKTNNTCADQNQDGIVDLQDFSIMMYYWTG